MPRLFAQVIVPLSLHDAYTYEVPERLQPQVEKGKRVVVQFGRKKFYAALVVSLSEKSPENIETKEIVQVLDDHPVVLPQNLELWKWMAAYYCCTLGDIFRAALPPGLKLESKSKILFAGNDDEKEITEEEQQILFQLEQDVNTLEGLQRKLGDQFSYAALKSLLKKNIVQIEEKISSK